MTPIYNIIIIIIIVIITITWSTIYYYGDFPFSQIIATSRFISKLHFRSVIYLYEVVYSIIPKIHVS